MNDILCDRCNDSIEAKHKISNNDRDETNEEGVKKETNIPNQKVGYFDYFIID
jgi:hypothetical protein